MCAPKKKKKKKSLRPWRYRCAGERNLRATSPAEISQHVISTRRVRIFVYSQDLLACKRKILVCDFGVVGKGTAACFAAVGAVAEVAVEGGNDCRVGDGYVDGFAEAGAFHYFFMFLGRSMKHDDDDRDSS